MTFVEFFGDSYMLSVAALLAIIAAVSIAARIMVGILRTLNIALRGWPPGHLDADGDWLDN